VIHIPLWFANWLLRKLMPIRWLGRFGYQRGGIVPSRPSETTWLRLWPCKVCGETMKIPGPIWGHEVIVCRPCAARLSTRWVAHD
jgi:hypothetical protein